MSELLTHIANALECDPANIETHLGAVRERINTSDDNERKALARVIDAVYFARGESL